MGDDTLAGEAGADEIDGGEGLDTLDYSGSPAGVVVDFAAGTGAGGDAEGDRVVNIENVWGSSFADNFTGSGGTVSISGLGGDDVLDGSAGHDRLAGGDGNDILRGLDGDDKLLGESGSDKLSGGSGADRLFGGKGSDTFIFTSGEEGADTITDFVNAEDRIDLSGFAGLLFEDLVISGDTDDSMIDLTGHGGARIALPGVNVSDLDPADFLFAR